MLRGAATTGRKAVTVGVSPVKPGSAGRLTCKNKKLLAQTQPINMKQYR